jgi:hypothetical protein
MSHAAFYSIHTCISAPRVLSILLEYIDEEKNVVVDRQMHTITMHPDAGKAIIEIKSDDDRPASVDVYLEPTSVVCIDFLPPVFDSSVLPMYAISPGRVAVFIQPFAAGVDVFDRPVVRFEDGMFEDVIVGRGRRIRIKTDAENTGVSRGGQLWGGEVAVKWGANHC